MGNVIDGDKLRRLIKEKGMSVEGVASAIGVTPYAVYKYLSEERNPSLPAFVAIAELLEVEMEELIKKEGSDQSDVSSST